MEAIGVTRYRVIVEVALHDRLEPLSGFSHRLVHALTKLLLNVNQLSPHSLADRVALHREVPVSVLPADVRESQEVERLRLSLTAPCPVLRRKAAELNHARESAATGRTLRSRGGPR